MIQFIKVCFRINGWDVVLSHSLKDVCFQISFQMKPFQRSVWVCLDTIDTTTDRF